jgi:hypothetical protein
MQTALHDNATVHSPQEHCSAAYLCHEHHSAAHAPQPAAALPPSHNDMYQHLAAIDAMYTHTDATNPYLDQLSCLDQVHRYQLYCPALSACTCCACMLPAAPAGATALACCQQPARRRH